MPNPRVALINIGEEEEKGNMLAQAAYPLMKEGKQFNFVGNIEGLSSVQRNAADVFVADGFTGNVVLKNGGILLHDRSLKKQLKDEFFGRFNYEIYGGSPILGINAPVVVGHGISTPEAIKNMVLLSKKMAESDLINKIKQAFQ